MDFLTKILAIAEARGLNQGDLERLANLPINRISKWRCGQGEPHLSHAVKIARALRVSLDYLTDESASIVPGESDAEGEREILAFCRRIGFEIAWDRLAALSRESAATPADGSPTYAEEIRPPKHAGRGTRKSS